MNTNFAMAIVIAGTLAAGQAIADKPSWAGGGKGKGESVEHKGNSESNKSRQRQHDESSPRDSDGPAVKAHKHFDDRHRTAVHDYYNDEFRRGRCPPGLAKKENGCMPPGQAKKWAVGQPLPRNVVYHSVPAPLVAQFGRPPAGYRYVRVADDILLIAPRTGTVTDAILNLGRM